MFPTSDLWRSHYALSVVIGISLLAQPSLSANSIEEEIELCGWNPRHPHGPLDEDPECSFPVVIDQGVGPDPTSWAPWTHRPYCHGSGDNPVCVFTNDLVPQDDGISIITTPTSAASVMNLLAHRFDKPQRLNSSRTFDSRPYEVRDVPNKGKGAFATRNIERGSIVLENHALMLAPMNHVYQNGGVSPQQARELFERAAHQLPHSERLLSLSQHAGTDSLISPVQNIFDTNTFTVSVYDEEYNALFPDVARLNHACNPNCRVEWSEVRLAFTIWSLRDIEPGEELTLTYIPMGHEWTRQKRQETLLEGWGFSCTCPLCSASKSAIAASDKRRREFGALVRLFQTREVQGRYKDAVKALEKILAINRQEPMLTSTAQLYIAAARMMSHRSGDEKTARKYLLLAEDEMLKRGFGEDEMESIRNIRRSLDSRL